MMKIPYTLVKMRPELGAELRRARTARGLSLDAAGRAANISQGYLHKLEAGRVDSPSPRVLQRLGEVLGVPYRRLMDLAGYLPPDVAPRPRGESAMPTGAPPTNHELARLLERVLEELTELRRDQRALAEALARAAPHES